MPPTTAPDTLQFLHETRDVLFPGYRPEQPTEYACPVVVARIAAARPDAYSSVITETCYPAQFFKAKSTSAEGSNLKLDTGSGAAAGVLLNTFCLALAAGTAGFEEPEVPGDWMRKRKFHAQEDGAGTDVLVAGSHVRIDIDEQYDGLGGHTDSVTLYLNDVALALELAQAFSEGMLGLSFGR